MVRRLRPDSTDCDRTDCSVNASTCEASRSDEEDPQEPPPLPLEVDADPEATAAAAPPPSPTRALDGPYAGLPQSEADCLANMGVLPADLAELTPQEIAAATGTPCSVELLHLRLGEQSKLQSMAAAAQTGNIGRLFPAKPAASPKQPPQDRGAKTLKTALVRWRQGGSTVDVTETERAARMVAASMAMEILLGNKMQSAFRNEIAASQEQGKLTLWQQLLTNALASKFDHRSMRQVAATWRRWLKWRSEQPQHLRDEPAAPSALNFALFLDDISHGGHTAAWGALGHFKWLRAHLGFEGIPLESPLLTAHAAPGTRSIEQHAGELNLAAWRQLLALASKELGAVSLFAKATICLVASSLRFRHAQRARFLPEHCDARCLLLEITRGKVRRGAPFQVAVPTHVAPNSPLLLEFYEELGAHMGNPGFLIPDVKTRKREGFCPTSEVLPLPMPYNRFMGCLRSLLMAEPLALCAADARKVSSYSLRRKLPTIADALRLPIECRQELGDWREHVQPDGAQRKRAVEPMSVRYSSAKHASASQTRRLCLLALSRLTSDQDEDEALRRLGASKDRMMQEVLGPEWGVGAEATTRQPPPDPAACDAIEPDLGDSPSPGSDHSTQSGPSSSGDQLEPEEVEWLLPRGASTKLHLRSLCDGEDGRPVPCCRKNPFAWGCETGAGVASAESTSREWSPRCAAMLRKRTAMTRAG